MTDETPDNEKIDEPSSSQSGRSIREAFKGRTEPATVEDLAILYTRIMLVIDGLVSTLGVGVASRDERMKSFNEVREVTTAAIKGIAEDLNRIGKRKSP